MLKRLFLVIFILQSFATTAYAGMDMSNLNQADKIKMQFMHQVMDKNNIHSSDGAGQNSKIHSMIDCSECDQNSNCHDLMCSSIHATTAFYPQKEMSITEVLVGGFLKPNLTILVQYSNSQPETPPPSI
ncbi:hypothetical protein CYQ88_03315 [Hydrogenovibrio sp. SC-1]|uniref:hypothetical protein n=1 Tax=Hydrogenovibrio sp. SC-1 TaxID=2065820 RepID=UPI000C7BC07C|nr:hypothetical protein [Hydrogenovibrio sp. SC-1]PLA74942.1 hypothetical protein CYQ88_03315 [Hydrogenovibrio sp. SC-1]